MLSDENLSPDEEVGSETSKKATYEEQVEQASLLLEELKASGINELEDQIRELRDRFPAHVVTKVLKISGKQLRAARNPQKRVQEAASATILDVLTQEAKQLSQAHLERWLELGKAVDELDVDEYASGRGLSVRDYLQRAVAFYQTFFPVIKERVDEILA
jgi:hypothetical protein